MLLSMLMSLLDKVTLITEQSNIKYTANSSVIKKANHVSFFSRPRGLTRESVKPGHPRFPGLTEAYSNFNHKRLSVFL